MTEPDNKQLLDLLKPLQTRLDSIDASLRTLADAKLIELFCPDTAVRTEWINRFEQAIEADSAAFAELRKQGAEAQERSKGGYDALAKEIGEEKAKELTKPLTEAMEARQETSHALGKVRAEQPVLARLYGKMLDNGGHY